ncbi:MAG: hypothetical protein ACREOS_10805 [Candidatus Dormibacteraceae bacterium]
MQVCVVCGRDLPRAAAGRRRLFCSAACRQRAYRLNEQERLWRGSRGQAADAAEVARLLSQALRRPPRR